jgi:hypothetical protein
VNASHGRPSASFSGTKKPLGMNHVPIVQRLLTQNNRIATVG